MNRQLAAFLASVVLISAAHASTTWYIDANATAPGQGTQASPYTSIQYAINQSTTHQLDLLLVAPGEYAAFTVQNRYLMIRSTQGPELTRINGAIFIDLGLGLEGFTLTNGGDVFTTDMSHCVILGAGVRIKDDAEISHCVFYGCTHAISDWGFSGGGYRINHCVFWNCPIAVSTAAAGEMSFCAGQTNPSGFGWITSNNVPGDPLLWDPAQSNMRLRPGSPCIDAGDPTAPPDPDGSRADIGLIPYDPTYAPAPTNYCTGKLNSLGCVPAISAIGSASATSSAAFSIHATNLLVGKPGLLLVGVGKSAQAFQGGLLCVQPPLHRVGAQNSIGTVGCDGTFRCNMQGHIQNGSLPSLVPGTLAYCQWWSRDPQDPAGYGSSLTDALSFGIAP